MINIKNKAIFENIKAKAKNSGISLNEIEKQAGISKGAIYKWQNSDPSVTSLKAVADILGCTVDDLLG